MEWLILYIALYYLGSPIIVKYKHFHKRFSEPQRLNPQSFPKEIFDYFYKIGNDLTALGFSPRVYFRNTGQVPNVVSYYTLWVNEKTKDYAIAALMNVNRSIIKRQIPLISIISEYIDGTKVYTHNSSQPAIFKRRPNRKVRHIPKCGDVTLLFQIHNKFIDELGINLAKTPPAEGNEEFYFYKATVMEFEEQIKAGYYYFDPKSDKYKLTIKGSYVVAWKLIWPMKQIRMYLLKNKAEKYIGEINKDI